jgi:hypothetical protein
MTCCRRSIDPAEATGACDIGVANPPGEHPAAGGQSTLTFAIFYF